MATINQWRMISIHAPNERSDLYDGRDDMGVHLISIHAPNERSDSYDDFIADILAISIHAPNERSDASCVPMM